MIAADFIDNVSLTAPELMDAEVLSALRRLVLGGHLEEVRALMALDLLADWPVRRVSHRDLTRLAWQYRENVSAYDALYVATARHFGLPILTADPRLSRASGLGIVVQTVGIG